MISWLLAWASNISEINMLMKINFLAQIKRLKKLVSGLTTIECVHKGSKLIMAISLSVNQPT